MSPRPALFFAFAGLGATTAGFAAYLPTASARLGTDVSAGVPALFAGLLLGVLITTSLTWHAPAWALAASGAVLQAAALVGVITAATAPLFLLAALAAGCGFGMTETAGNLLAKAAAASATSLLARLTGTVAIVAAITPLVIAAAGGIGFGWGAIAAVIVLHLATSLLLVLSRRNTGRSRSTPLRVRALRPYVTVAATLFLFVGVESVLSGWSATIPAHLLALDPSAAALATSLFWILMALGRFGFGALVTRGVSPLRVFGYAMAGAAVTMTVAALSAATAPVLTLGALALTVLAFAPGYAVLIGMALDALPADQAPPVVGALVAAGAIGGTVLPLAIVTLSDGPTSIGSFLLCAGGAVVIAVVCFIRTARLS